MKRSAPPITVLCADDHPDMVRALRAMIDMERDMISVDGVYDTSAVMDAALALRPQVTIIDLSMPGPIAPVDAIRRLAAELPAMRVIVYSGHDDPRTRDRVSDAGAWGLVSKAADPRELLDAVRRAAASAMAV